MQKQSARAKHEFQIEMYWINYLILWSSEQNWKLYRGARAECSHDNAQRSSFSKLSGETIAQRYRYNVPGTTIFNSKSTTKSLV